MKADFKIDFLGIGPAKAGTTWVGHMLERHPALCMAEPKEVHFFNDSLSFNRSFATSHFPLGPDWYQKHFKHCAAGSLKGEFTPRYIIDPVVPRRLFEHNPALKMIVCLRSPFERIVSHYHSVKDYHQKEPRTISEAIREEPEYIDACMYHANISRYLAYFDLQQFFFVDLDEIKSDPEGLLNRLYTFLGVDAGFIPEGIRKKSNPARSTRSPAIRKWSWKFQRQLIVWGFSPFIIFLKKAGVGRWLNRLNSGPLEIVRLTDDDRKYIRERVEEDNIAFGRLIGKDLSHWFLKK